MSDQPLDLDKIRERLATAKGKEYWRCLEELADAPAFQQALKRDFPRQTAVWDGMLNRRSFLKLMGASLALAGLASCYSPPKGQIVPYVHQPDNVIPGKPLYFASAMPRGGYGRGVLAESNEGRPTKIEGNTDHPASLGATDVFMQASILSLYDPDRSQVALNQGRIRTWDAFLQEFRSAIDTQRGRQGAGLRILTETVTSPTLADQLSTLLKNFPKAKWHQYEPANRDNVRAGAQLAFGQYVETVHHFDKADIVLSLDSDFMLSSPGNVRYGHDFALRRRPGTGTPQSRVYTVESTLTLTGAKSDHRLPLRASDVSNFARAVAPALGIAGASGQAPGSVPPRWIPALVADLKAHRGASLVIAGEHQPPYVHALAHALNDALGNVGNTVTYHDPAEATPTDQLASLRDLVNDLTAGHIDLFVIAGANPVYYAPADLNFAQALQKAGLRVHLGLYDDETSALCQWHIPQTHYLEEWSDVRAFDGSATIIQPLIAPLYGGHSMHELFASFGATPDSPGHDLVQNYWKGHLPAGASSDFATFWRDSLNAGVVANTASKSRTATLKTDWIGQPPAAPPSDLEIVFRPDPTIYDGRYANNGWLQELPKPFSKVTWDSIVLLSPGTAQQLHVTNADLVELRYQGQTLHGPAWIMPGHVDNSVTVYLGGGRTRGGQVADGVGYNAYTLQTSRAPWFDGGLQVVALGQHYDLAGTQQHSMIEGRNLVRAATLAEFQQNPHFAPDMDTEKPESLYAPYQYTGYAWGMAIDLSTCIGCNACVIACQAENNIPITGKDQVLRGREMHWLRIDTYFAGNFDNPETNFEPVPCMQCENAPCELVCPVGATVHSSEGLNDMVYNRCVGTRYCSNNCPYKVRRFNFYKYADYQTPSLKLLHNPNVTVRERGVMEKCTYCVQRIDRARIQAEVEGRTVRDGDILTACQAACPADAIIFGNINDKNSRVAQFKANPRNYILLAELNTRPRTSYEAIVRNPNPELQT